MTRRHSLAELYAWLFVQNQYPSVINKVGSAMSAVLGKISMETQKAKVFGKGRRC
jgi:hypothetical protein